MSTTSYDDYVTYYRINSRKWEDLTLTQQHVLRENYKRMQAEYGATTTVDDTGINSIIRNSLSQPFGKKAENEIFGICKNTSNNEIAFNIRMRRKFAI